MSEARQFHLGDILSVTTGKLVSPRLIEGVYDVLNFMTGESLYTHQLPRVSRGCAPAIIRQHPALTEVDASSVDGTNWRTWLDGQIARLGEMLSIEPLAYGEHERIDPMSELAEMVHPDRIVVVQP